ncbi:MAG: Maf family protein [Solirubrobacterales bacterium]
MLASASPQRREILSSAGVSFEVAPTGVEEAVEGEPAWVALENARRKARAGLLHHPEPGAVVLAADTVVALDGEILDKPAGAAQARESITALAGRTHEVFGGIVLAGPGDRWREASRVSRVTFRPLTATEVEAYVATGEWEGRAGGYAIQLSGSALVESLEGEEANVIGLSREALAGLVQGLVPSGGEAADRYNP